MSKKKRSKLVLNRPGSFSLEDSGYNHADNISHIAKIVLSISLCLIFTALILSLFMNIQYPLFWNDESETAMYAKRILQYGYPKIHDGKNIVWLSELPDKSIGIDPKTDSCRALVWGQYYFGAIGTFFADMTDDLYLKTALIRIPFALAGLVGLCIMALSILGLFKKSAIDKLSFLNLFFFFTLISVSLALHLRDARHPPLVVFLSACIFAVYFNYRYYNKINRAIYIIALTVILFLLYNVLHVVCFIFFIAIGLYEVIMLLKEKDAGSFANNIAPVVIASLLVIPAFFSCQTFAFGKAYKAASYMASWGSQTLNLFNALQRHEFLYLVLTTRAIFLCLWVLFLNRSLIPCPAVKRKLQVSNFLSFFLAVYALFITLFPSPALFERYFIVLQPIMTMILLLDIFGTLELLSQIPRVSKIKLGQGIYVLILMLVMLFSMPNKIDPIRWHIYELLHQYKGPLDFAIPFIKERYKNAEEIVIATNYEELSYMYYLGSKVIVGFVGNNIKEDSAMRPDIIIFRKKTVRPRAEVFNNFRNNAKYERISFPV